MLFTTSHSSDLSMLHITRLSRFPFNSSSIIHTDNISNRVHSHFMFAFAPPLTVFLPLPAFCTSHSVSLASLRSFNVFSCRVMTDISLFNETSPSFSFDLLLFGRPWPTPSAVYQHIVPHSFRYHYSLRYAHPFRTRDDPILFVEQIIRSSPHYPTHLPCSSCVTCYPTPSRCRRSFLDLPIINIHLFDSTADGRLTGKARGLHFFFLYLLVL